jgi:hypothetical protein
MAPITALFPFSLSIALSFFNKDICREQYVCLFSSPFPQVRAFPLLTSRWVHTFQKSRQQMALTSSTCVSCIEVSARCKNIKDKMCPIQDFTFRYYFEIFLLWETIHHQPKWKYHFLFKMNLFNFPSSNKFWD